MAISDFKYVATPGGELRVCGFTSFDWSGNCDFPGNDLSSQWADKARKCARVCEQTVRCSHFTWDSVYQVCWMKEKAVGKSEFFWRQGAVCGIVNNKYVDCHKENRAQDVTKSECWGRGIFCVEKRNYFFTK